MKFEFTILYVEDSDSAREGLSLALKKTCDNLVLAKDGVEGLEKYKQYTPDIVISDINMPKKNGIQLAKEIKKIDPNQVIIFTTAYSDNGYFIDSIELQISAYILKPIDIKVLKEKILYFKNQLDAEKKIARQQILLEKIISLEDSMILVLDANQNILFANKAFYSFFNISSIGEFKNRYKNLKSVISFEDGTKLDSKNYINSLHDASNENKIVKIDIDSKKENYFILFVRYIEDTQDTIVRFTEITDIEKDRIECKIRIFKDELTGLYNRAFFNEELERSLRRYERDSVAFSLILYDIDFFKQINDNYGHQKGDEILKELSFLVEKNIRKSDILARWGGEEFMIILPNTDALHVKQVALELKNKINSHHFVDDLDVRCSYGVTTIEANDTKDSLIKRVDDALYEAKNSGRNMVIQK